jgi:putative ABC transport system substrate-binding protein
MRRREFITLVGGAAAAWPVAARGQQNATIGFLGYGSPEGEATAVAAFRAGLNEADYTEGRNVAIEFRWAQSEAQRLPELAADLVRRRVDVIVVPAGTPAVQAAKEATATIPIVFHTGADPVQSGLVQSLNHPGGNLTGITAIAPVVVSKLLGLLHEMRPGSGLISILINEADSFAGQTSIARLQEAAAVVGRPVRMFGARDSAGIDSAFAEIVGSKAEAMLVTPSNLIINRAGQIATLCARNALPAISARREFPLHGGLMSYGSNVADQLRQVASYVARILKGEKPADLPVMQATKLQLVINLQTARTLGITVPPSLLATADEVIE